MTTPTVTDTVWLNSTTDAPAASGAILEWFWQNICRLILGIVGIIGNALVVIVYNSKKKTNTTNVLILALACADLVSSVFFIPLPIVQYVPYNFWGELYCRIIWSQAFLWTSIEASVYTLTLLSVERYLAVVHPIRYRNVFSKARPKRFIWVLWLFALIVKSFNLYNVKINSNHMCEGIKFPAGVDVFVSIGIAIIEYFIPITVMSLCNFFAIRALRVQAHNLQEHNLGGATRESGPALSILKTRRKVINMVLFVIILFIICWTPDQISLILVNLNILPLSHVKSNIHQAFVILAFTNSCVNPFIYTFKNKSFRASVMALFGCRSVRVADLMASTMTDTGGGTVETNVQERTTAVNTISKPLQNGQDEQAAPQSTGTEDSI